VHLDALVLTMIPFTKVLGLFGLLLTTLMDQLYDLVARNRYRVFGRQDRCLTSRPEYRGRFI
jgi:predicted DCC family thiol-disulfide oxidoreductase YuxK